jgi:hypothetical protein
MNNMTTATEIVDTVQSGVLKAIETSQRLTIEALSAAASTIDSLLPERLSAPFATALEVRQEVIDAGFGFAEQLLNGQKAFFSQLVAVTTPAKKVA